MLNHITIMGRMTRDPELRHTQSDIPVASFTLAVDRDFKEKAVTNALRTLSTVLHGGTAVSLLQSISRKAVRRSFPAGCKSVTGQTERAINAAARRSL